MKNNYVRLFRSTKHNGVASWEIWSNENGQIVIETMQSMSASPITFIEEIDKGLAGRSVEEQIKLRMNSRIKNKRDHGYTPNYELAASGMMANQLNFDMPMLAERFKNIKTIDLSSIFIQPKLDGHRCLITRVGDEYFAYSRGGNMINTIDHILKDLQFPDGYTLDGELYHHGTKLQTIGSWVKRLQPMTQQLKFMCYDVITPFNDPYSARLNFLLNNVDFDPSKMRILNTIDGSELIADNVSLVQTLRITVADGYEGLILRPKNGLYGIGRRTKDLIKLKRYDLQDLKFEDEFIVTDVTESRFGLAVLHCVTEEGKTFKATAPGNRLMKDEILRNKVNYIGKWINIEYAEMTNDGKPFQPVATKFVDKL